VLGWIRSAALLDGDWGTSIAYVLGIAFALGGYSSFYHLMMMLGLTALVAVNYITICRLHPNGGGVYSSVYHRSKTFAIIGALLLGADYIITVSLSVLDAFHYFNLINPHLWAIGTIASIGILNWFGPRHSGGFAIFISTFTVITILVIIIFSAPASVSQANLHSFSGGIINNWGIFVGIILSISGIEAISNMTGLMKDPRRDSRKAILSVLTKVAIATIFLALAMHSIPGINGKEHTEDMVKLIGEYYVGSWFGYAVALSLGLLLISAGNTAINDLINIQFLMSVDNELPPILRKLNSRGVPIVPLFLSTIAPILVLLTINDVFTLASLYAIGVVGAICINVASTGTDLAMPMKLPIRLMMIISAVILFLIELTISIEKPKATIFAAIVLGIGLTARLIARRKEVVTVEAVPIQISTIRKPRRRLRPPSTRYLVAVKDKSERLLQFAIEEAKKSNAQLIVLRVKEIKVGALPDRLPMFANGVENKYDEMCVEANVDYQILSIPSNEVAYTIVEQAAMFGVERIILGTPSRGFLESALRGNVMRTLRSILPEEIQMLIYGG
jgi:amino acid transporter